jgi:hypothetical protein
MNELRIKYSSTILEGYNDPCFVHNNRELIVNTIFTNLRAYNGYLIDTTDFKSGCKKVKKLARSIIMFNDPDQKLYLTLKFICSKPLTKEENEILNKEVDEFLSKNPVLKQGQDEIVLFNETQKIYQHAEAIPIPSNLYWLGSLFDTPEKQMMYEEFMSDRIIFQRLKNLCKLKNLKVDGMNTTAQLPVHVKDKNTGEILVSKVLINAFNQYQFAKNYLQFEKETVEYDMGKLLMLDPKFNDFVRKYAELNKTEISDNFKNEVNKSIKRVQKNNYLMKLFESDLMVEEATQE